MRCPDCAKFVAFDTDNEPEHDDAEVDEGGTVTVSGVRITNNCAECGQELKEASFDLEGTIDFPAEWCDEEGDLKEGVELSAEVVNAERTDRSDGKPNTPSRFRRTFYGATLTVEVTATDADGKAIGEPVSIELSDECQASGMDECC